ncbi:MAG: hypothetical protein ACJASD_001543 [Sphingomonas echinoides]|jgi:uncharacterized protein YbcV (DUF1398 family)
MVTTRNVAVGRSRNRLCENFLAPMPSPATHLVESYVIDVRRATATYYLPDGESIELPAHRVDAPIAPVFGTARMQAAIREAKHHVPGYSYKGFRDRAVVAGCAGYIVSFSGRRALYVGRTAETHVEHFPNQ